LALPIVLGRCGTDCHSVLRMLLGRCGTDCQSVLRRTDVARSELRVEFAMRRVFMSVDSGLCRHDGTGDRLCHAQIGRRTGPFHGPTTARARADRIDAILQEKIICALAVATAPPPGKGTVRDRSRARRRGTKGFEKLPLCATLASPFRLLKACNKPARARSSRCGKRRFVGPWHRVERRDKRRFDLADSGVRWSTS
jgi:hypothetical protein